jgi:hypothetical protein
MLKDARTPAKIRHVPNQPRATNPHRSVRVEDEDWKDGDAVTHEMGTTRGRILNEFLLWYLRRPGAKLPQRPTAEIVDAAVRARLQAETATENGQAQG